MNANGGPVSPQGRRALQVVCETNAWATDYGDWGPGEPEARPFVAASAHHGLVEGDLHSGQPSLGRGSGGASLGAADAASSATSESSHKVRQQYHWR